MKKREMFVILTKIGDGEGHHYGEVKLYSDYNKAKRAYDKLIMAEQATGEVAASFEANDVEDVGEILIADGECPTKRYALEHVETPHDEKYLYCWCWLLKDNPDTRYVAFFLQKHIIDEED